MFFFGRSLYPNKIKIIVELERNKYRFINYKTNVGSNAARLESALQRSIRLTQDLIESIKRYTWHDRLCSIAGEYLDWKIQTDEASERFRKVLKGFSVDRTSERYEKGLEKV